MPCPYNRNIAKPRGHGLNSRAIFGEFTRNPCYKNRIRAYLLSVFAVCAAFLIVCSPAFAHHGGSMYDMAHLASVKGTVTEFEWANPHVMIYADVIDGKGNIQKRSIETRGGRICWRRPVTKNTIKVGEHITLVGHNRNGSPNMRLQKVIFANGMELYPKTD